MSIDTDYRVLRDVLADMAAETATSGVTGWAVEFGVYSGYSLNLIAECMPVIGFDSFIGLPEDWREGFPKGAFGDREGYLPVINPNQMIVPGWFEDSTRDFPFPALSLVHIDCDLYSSTVTALAAVHPHIGPGTIVVFDEFCGYDGWEDHEAKAWAEFCDTHEVTWETIARDGEEVAFVIKQLGF